VHLTCALLHTAQPVRLRGPLCFRKSVSLDMRLCSYRNGKTEWYSGERRSMGKVKTTGSGKWITEDKVRELAGQLVCCGAGQARGSNVDKHRTMVKA
jgi:hypothetical protein